MSVTVEMLDALNPGAIALDHINDKWVKRKDDSWDYVHARTEAFRGWSAKGLLNNYPLLEIAHDGPSSRVPEEEKVFTKEGLFTKQELLDELEDFFTENPAHPNTDAGQMRQFVYNELMEHFGIEPWQTMVIELHIPVKGLDPMGDTYTMGVEKIEESNLFSLAQRIQAVEIKEGN